MNTKEYELRECAQDAIAHAQLTGLPLGNEIGRITAELQAIAVSGNMDPASVLTAVEQLYEQLLTELVSQTIQRTIEIVQTYITSDQDPEMPKMAKQTVQLLNLLLAQKLPWEFKAGATLKALQQTGALNVLALRLEAGMIETEADQYFVNSIVPESRQLSGVTGLPILEVFPSAATEVRRYKRLDDNSSNPS